MNTLSPTVSVIIPCRNERSFISECLDSVIYNGYSTDRLQIVVVDGLSDDGTREVVLGYASLHPNVQLVDNPTQTTPAALNKGIQHSTGDLLLIMSAHASYDKHAIEKLIHYSFTYKADNVGGSWRIIPRDSGLLARAIVIALAHRFGVGGAVYRLRNQLRHPAWVDTAAYGCYRRDVFRRIGMYNEQLVHSQDMELNLRLKAAGGRTLLAPDVVIHYFARTDMRAFVKHTFRNGQWVILPFAFSEVMPVAWRHLVPFLFVTSLAATALVGFAVPRLWLVTCTIALLYAVAGFAASITVMWRERDARYLILMPVIFGTLHVAHGLGAVLGAMRLLCIRSFWRKLFSRRVPRQHRDVSFYSDKGQS